MTDRPAATNPQGSEAAASPRTDDTTSHLNVPASAVLDEAHLGDIEGALGKISISDIGERRGWKRRLLTFAAIVGPGLIVMVGDNDAGGVSTLSLIHI